MGGYGTGGKTDGGTLAKHVWSPGKRSGYLRYGVTAQY